MTDTPAESAEAPRTPSPIEEICNDIVQQWCEGVDLDTAVRGAIEESVRARDAEWQKAVRDELGDSEVWTEALRALLSKGKPGQ